MSLDKKSFGIRSDNMKWLTDIDECGDQLFEPREGEGHKADEVGGGDDSSTNTHAHTRHTHADSTQVHTHHTSLIQLWPEHAERSNKVKKTVIVNSL